MNEIDWKRRVEQLEQRVSTLEQELSVLKKPLQKEENVLDQLNIQQTQDSLEVAESSATNKWSSQPDANESERSDGTARDHREYRESNAQKGKGKVGVPSSAPNKQPRDLEHLLVRVWLPRVFIIVLLVGVLWGFLAAASAGYITEGVRCLLGALVAGAMFVAGVRQMKQNRTGLGKVLLGGAHGIFVLSISAAHLLYGLLSVEIAVLFYIASMALAITTAFRWKSQTLVVLSVLSGYLLPFLVENTYANVWIVVGYQVAFSALMLILASRYRYVVAYWFAFGMLHFALLATAFIFYSYELSALLLGSVILQHILLYILFAKSDRGGTKQSAFQFTAFGVLALWAYFLYEGTDSFVYWSILIIGGLAYAFLAYLLRKKPTSTAQVDVLDGKLANGKELKQPLARAREAISIVIATMALMLFTLNIVGASYGATILFVQGLLALLLGLRLRYQLQYVAGLIVTFLAGVAIVSNPPIAIISEETLGWIILLIGIPVLYFYYPRLSYQKLNKASDVSQRRPMLSGLLWIEALLGLAFISILTNLFTENVDQEMRHFILSAVWLVYAIGAIVLGIIFKKAKARIAGVLFLFVVLMKVIFVDMPDVSLGIRALLFMIMGAVGIGISRLLYTNKDQSGKGSDVDPDHKV
ncbi:DUF2339 domain-containing protein [Bacillus horti]|uniref:Membrane protein n=1 Tax=Caldalkalibacillus horti TaxID=77523 RepID=A0ABT9W3A3_9BACI|nr:DUF2339 domain-containing protein [Bacillus horti]MDQ0167723.1 putative membrane protein [Bacillus horti]